jgi:hypothetical protein
MILCYIDRTLVIMVPRVLCLFDRLITLKCDMEITSFTLSFLSLDVIDLVGSSFIMVIMSTRCRVTIIAW